MTEYAFAPDWLLNSSSSGCLPFTEAIGGYVLVDQCTFPSVPSPIIEPTDPTIPIPPIDHGCYELSLTGSFHGPEDPLTGDGGVSISIAYPTGDICEPEIDIGIFVPCFVNISATTEAAGEQRVAEEPTFGVTVLDGGWPVGSSSSGIACDFRLKFTLDMPCPIDFSPNLSSAEALGTTDDTFWDSPPTTMTAVRRWAHGQPVGRVLAWPGHRYPEESSSGLIETECFPRLELDLDLPCPAGGGHIASGDWATHWMFQSIFEQSDVDSLIAIRQARYDTQYGVDASLHPHHDELPAGVIQLNRAVDDFTAWGSTGPVPAIQEKFRGWIDKNEFDENCELDLGLSLYIPCGMHGTDITFYESDNSTPAADWSAAVLQDWSDPFTEQECAFDYELRFYPPPPGGAPNESLAIIVCAPGGESEFYDERYWAQFADLVSVAGSAAAASLDPDANAVVPTTNITEQEFHTHGLRIGTPIELTERQDLGGTTRWIFAMLPFTVLVWVGGSFAAYGTAFANSVVSWNNGVWTTYVSAFEGVVDYSFNNVKDHTVIGGELYIGGPFEINNFSFVLLKWDDATQDWIGANPTDDATTYSNVRAVYSRHAYAISSSSLEPGYYPPEHPEDTAFDDHIYIALNIGTVPNPGPRLYRVDVYGPLGGYAHSIQNPANWEEIGWYAAAVTRGRTVNTLYACTINNEEFLYAAASDTAGATTGNCIFRWKEGQSWQPVGDGLRADTPISAAHDLIKHDIDGCLYVVGYFNHTGGTVLNGDYVAKWDGSTWEGIGYNGDPLSNRLGAYLQAVESFNGRIWVGRGQTAAGGIDATVLYYENNTWTAFDPRLGYYHCDPPGTCAETGGEVYAMRVHENMLAVGGEFDHIKIGATGEYCGPLAWHTCDHDLRNDPYEFPILSRMLAGKIYASKIWNGKLYVGGDFDITIDNVRYRNIAAYGLTTGTHPLEQVGNGVTGVVRSLEVYKGPVNTSSSGRDVLYIGGTLSECDPGVQTGGSMVIKHFCFWDPLLGTAGEFNIPGTAPGNTFNGPVLCMKRFTHTVFSTDVLAVGGEFDRVWGNTGYVLLVTYDADIDASVDPVLPWRALNSEASAWDDMPWIAEIDVADDFLYVVGNFDQLGLPQVTVDNVTRLDLTTSGGEDWLPLRDTDDDPANNGITGRGYSIALRPYPRTSSTVMKVYVGCQPCKAGDQTPDVTSGLWIWTVDLRSVTPGDPAGSWDELPFYGSSEGTWYGATHALTYSAEPSRPEKLYAAMQAGGECGGVGDESIDGCYVAELTDEPCWDKLGGGGANSVGYFDKPVFTISIDMTDLPGEVLVGGEFIYTAVDVSAEIHRPAEALVAITTDDEWFDISGGCGIFGPDEFHTGVFGVDRLNSFYYGVDELGNYVESCRQLFASGVIGSVSKGYSPMALGLDARRYIPLQGGLWPSTRGQYRQGVRDARIGGETNNEICMIGEFGGGWNRKIKLADAAGGIIREFITSQNAILWDGTYWKKFKTNSENLGARPFGVTCSYYKASGETEGQWYGAFLVDSTGTGHGVYNFDRPTDTWVRTEGTDPDKRPTGALYCMLVYNSELWLCGDLTSVEYIANGGPLAPVMSFPIARWDGTEWVREDYNPDWVMNGYEQGVTWMCLADVTGGGEELFILKGTGNLDSTSSDAAALWRHDAGTTWTPVLGTTSTGRPQLQGQPEYVAPFSWCGKDYLLVSGAQLQLYPFTGDTYTSPSTVLYDDAQDKFFPIEWKIPTAGAPGQTVCGMTDLGDCTQHLQRALTGGGRNLVRPCSPAYTPYLYSPGITEWRPADTWGENCPGAVWTPDSCALHDLVEGGINGMVINLYEQRFLPPQLDCS